MTTATRQSELSARTTHGRAVNAVAEFLRSTLSVPNIYLEPRNVAVKNVDVLAVDRAGAGDLHGVSINVPSFLFVSSLTNLRSLLAELRTYPTHYRYLALPKTEALLQALPNLQLFSPDGIGRVGILTLEERQEGLPLVQLAVIPERYRVPSSIMDRNDKFLAKNRPDIEVRI